ncbi:GGDEF domain-containing protein [Paenibacillus bovis]|uniref:Diguanylate cyclase n=1 Tax=Paenibacillus bovis TaxID=1616788 RepID=A0A172ZAS5_9BACL|nr:GGDEF domain-containing protein [Paenibacillus bovis]ANF94718.1 diguanylate cyclase [Paenibacillus bovis]
MSFKLRTVLVVVFIVLSLVLSGTLGWVMNRYAVNSMKEEIGDSLFSTAHNTADKLDNFMWSRSGEMDLLAQLPVLRNSNNMNEVHDMLDQLQSSFPSFSWIGYTDLHGKVMASTDNILLGKDLSERPVYREGIKKKFIGDVHDAVLLAKLLPNPSGEPLQFVDISLPVINNKGQKVGVLAAHMSWDWAREVKQSVMESFQQKDKDIEVMIVSQKDQVVLLGPDGMVGQKLPLSSVKKAQSGQSGWELEQWPDGHTYLTGYAYGDGYMDYPGLGWTVLVRQPESTALASISDMNIFTMIAGMIATIVFALIGWFLANKISLPIRALTHRADRLSEKEIFDIPVQRGFYEIEILSRSLRAMVTSLMQKDVELDQMQAIAHYDHLTGLPNRNALETYLESTLAEHEDNPSQQLSFLYIDLDGFKKVNDTLGHQAGDILLQKVAQRLSSLSKDKDITVRLGGDEFLVVLHTSQDHPYDEARAYGEQIISLLNKPFVLEYQKIHIGCSIGGAVYMVDSDNPIEIVRMADQALYQSKRAGKNRITFYNADSLPQSAM